MTLTTEQYNNMLAEHLKDARDRGHEAGKNAASWVFDGNTPEQTYAQVAHMLDDGDPAIDDAVSEPHWLSGEWSGESIQELLGDLLLTEDDSDDCDEFNNAIEEQYEEAAHDTFWATVEHDATSHTGEDGEGIDDQETPFDDD